MKTLLLNTFIFLAISLNAQVWLSENFDAITFPPDGWTIDQFSDNWKYTASNFAGGTAGEASLKTLPTFDGTTRFISPALNITQAENLFLSFNYTLKLYQGGIVIGVAKRSNGGEWTSIWEVDGHTTNNAVMDISLEEEGNIPGFQFCFYYSGSSGRLILWAIDDILIYEKEDHDMAAKKVEVDTYFEPSEEITPKVKIYNNGLNTESPAVNCHILDTANNLLYTDTYHIDTLHPSEYQEVTFLPFILPNTPDMAYQIVVSTNIEGDMNHTNDTTDAYIYTYVTYPHDMVVLEIGTATWCSACPYASEAADAIINNGYNLALIEYHTGDDYTTTASDSRTLDYYAMYGFPTAYFDGVVKQVGAGPNFYNRYFGFYYQRSLAKTGITIAMNADKTKDDYQINVTISKLAPVFNKNAVVHLVVTESHIPEEWQTEDELNFVCRLMLPDAMGTKINFAEEDEITIGYTITPDTSWNFNELEVVAFVQDNDSHEILNAVKAPLSELSGITELGEMMQLSLDNYPNPFSSSTKFRFQLNDNTLVQLQVFDITGKLIGQPLNGNLKKGKHEINWNTGNLPGGIYLVKLTAGKQVMVKKICKQND